MKLSHNLGIRCDLEHNMVWFVNTSHQRANQIARITSDFKMDLIKLSRVDPHLLCSRWLNVMNKEGEAALSGQLWVLRTSTMSALVRKKKHNTRLEILNLEASHMRYSGTLIWRSVKGLGNWFVISRVCYYENLNLTNLRKKIRNVRHIGG